jgi:hypothetical protein
MSRSARFILIGFLVFLGLGTVLIVQKDRLSRWPWETSIPFEFPHAALLGPGGVGVVSDRGDRRLTALTAGGDLVWQIQGGQRTGGFFSATPLGYGPDGRLWIFDTLIDAATDATVAVSLKPVAPDGRVGPAVWTHPVTAEESAAAGHIPFFPALSGASVYDLIGNAEDEYSLRKVDLGTGAEALVHRFPGLDVYQFNGAEVLSDDEVYFLDTNGRVLRWDPAGQRLAVVFDNGSSDVRLPNLLVRDGKGGLLVLDAKDRILQVREGKVRAALVPPPTGWYLSTLRAPRTVNFCWPTNTGWACGRPT